MVEELQRARDSWQAQAEPLALIAPTVIAAPAPAAAPETPAPEIGSPAEPISKPEPRRSRLRYWFGWKAAV